MIKRVHWDRLLIVLLLGGLWISSQVTIQKRDAEIAKLRLMLRGCK